MSKALITTEPTPQPIQAAPERIDMALWSRPTRITVTTPGTPPVPLNGRLCVTELPPQPIVQRRVAHGRTVHLEGRAHAAGATVRLPLDKALELTRAGALEPDAGPSPRDAA